MQVKSVIRSIVVFTQSAVLFPLLAHAQTFQLPSTVNNASDLQQVLNSKGNDVLNILMGLAVLCSVGTIIFGFIMKNTGHERGIHLIKGGAWSIVGLLLLYPIIKHFVNA